MKTGSQKLLENCDITDLPSLPQVLLRLLEACYQQNIAFERLSELIGQDAALSARVLAAANSPLYGRPKLGSFERALLVLGLDTIKTIVITASIQQVFSRFRGMDVASLKRFWKQSVACAATARLLAKFTGFRSPEEAYLAGLLHNLGQLILAAQHPDAYPALCAAAQGDTGLVALEQERFGASHCQLGSQLVATWNLGPDLADAVLYHHEPAEKLFDAPHLARIIHLASKIAETDASAPLPDDRLFGLTQAMLREIVQQAGENVRAIALSLNIDMAEEEAREGLAAEVRNVVLLRSVQPRLAGATDLEALLSAVRQSAELLFRAFPALLFLYDAESDCVKLKDADTPASDLAIPCEPGRSLIVDALLTGSPTRLVAGAPLPAAIDHRVRQLSQSEGILCLPMCAGQNRIGVLVLGTGPDIPEPRQKLMAMFAAEAAASIAGLQQQAELETQTLYRAQIRQLAHEANNPLGIIKNYVQILRMKLEREHPAREDLKIISEEIDRVAGIILRMSDVAKGQESPPAGPVSLNEIISDLATLLQDSLLAHRGIEIGLDLDGGLPAVVTKRNAVKQVLINLIKNAAEAMAEGGRISVATRDHVNLDGSEHVEIQVADNGPGLPPEVLAHLFEPVTSTKGAGHGGLGLSIVKNLVKELGGSINCRSDKGGTFFHILLPRILKEGNPE